MEYKYDYVFSEAELNRSLEALENISKEVENGMVDVVIPDFVKAIPYNFLAGCKKIKSIVWKYDDPDYEATIEPSAFYDCTSLEYALLPRLCSFEKNAFNNCTALKSVEFYLDNYKNQSDTEFYEGAFANCVNLKKIDINGYIHVHEGVDIETCINIPKKHFWNCIIDYNCRLNLLIDGVAPKRVELKNKRIYNRHLNLINACNSIDEIEIKDEISYCETLLGCSHKSLKIYVPSLEKWIGAKIPNDIVGYGVPVLGYELYCNGKKCTQIPYFSMIMAGCTSIKTLDFKKIDVVRKGNWHLLPSVENIIFSKKLSTIWSKAFAGCKNIKSVTIPDSNPKLVSKLIDALDPECPYYKVISAEYVSEDKSQRKNKEYPIEAIQERLKKKFDEWGWKFIQFDCKKIKATFGTRYFISPDGYIVCNRKEYIPEEVGLIVKPITFHFGSTEELIDELEKCNIRIEKIKSYLSSRISEINCQKEEICYSLHNKGTLEAYIMPYCYPLYIDISQDIDIEVYINDQFKKIKQYIEKLKEPVDLGLSVLWSSCNLGLSRPGDRNVLFRWGEIEPFYSDDPWDNSVDWKIDKPESMDWEVWADLLKTKALAKLEDSNPQSNNLSEDDIYLKNISNSPHDAARAILGDGWRMPTSKECYELIDKCEFSADDFGRGYWVKGPNGNSIFFPLASNTNYRVWSFSIHTANFCTCFEYTNLSWDDPSSFITEEGIAMRPIRPVKDK